MGGVRGFGDGHPWETINRRGLKLQTNRRAKSLTPSSHQKCNFTCFKRRAAPPKRVYKWVRRSSLHRTRIALAAPARPWPRSASVSLCVIWRDVTRGKSTAVFCAICRFRSLTPPLQPRAQVSRRDDVMSLTRPVLMPLLYRVSAIDCRTIARIVYKPFFCVYQI